MFPLQKACLGPVLDPAKNKGNDMTQWFIKDNGKIIPRRMVNKLMAENLAPSNEVEKGNMDSFDNKIISILGDSIDLNPVAPGPK